MTDKLRAAAQQALEALTNCNREHGHRCIRCDSEVDRNGKVAEAIRKALAKPVDEPRTIRMERVDRSTSQHWWSEAARIRMPSPELYAAGDTVLCWVNEGDLLMAGLPKRPAKPVQDHFPDATKTVQAPVQEPVAWRYQDSRGNYRYRGYVQGFDKEYSRLKPVPLYTAPPQQSKADPVQEPVVFRLLTDDEIQAEWSLTPQHEKAEGLWFGRRIERLVRDIALAQQRKPLTDEEIADLWNAQVFHIVALKLAKDFVRDLEAAHGIKENT